VYAAWLANQGYLALAPDYLTPIGVPKSQWSLEAGDWARNFLQIQKYLGDGVEAIKTLPYVIPNQIAVVGFSLGGYFAFILAERDDLKGIVSYYGAYVNVSEFSNIVAQIRVPILMLMVT
jgi:dienelactone hydrolase